MNTLIKKYLKTENVRYLDRVCKYIESILIPIALFVGLILIGFNLLGTIIMSVGALLFMVIANFFDSEFVAYFGAPFVMIYTIILIALTEYCTVVNNISESEETMNTAIILFVVSLFVWYLIFLLIEMKVPIKELPGDGPIRHFIQQQVTKKDYKKLTGLNFLDSKTVKNLRKHNPYMTKLTLDDETLIKYLTEDDLTNLVQLSESYSALNKEATNYSEMNSRLNALFQKTHDLQLKRESEDESLPDYLDELISEENESLVSMTEKLFNK